jgi:hypothetical protein
MHAIQTTKHAWKAPSGVGLNLLLEVFPRGMSEKSTLKAPTDGEDKALQCFSGNVLPCAIVFSNGVRGDAISQHSKHRGGLLQRGQPKSLHHIGPLNEPSVKGKDFLHYAKKQFTLHPKKPPEYSIIIHGICIKVFFEQTGMA